MAKQGTKTAKAATATQTDETETNGSPETNGEVQENILVCRYKGNEIKLVPSTGEFTTVVGTETVSRSTLPLLQRVIDKMGKGVKAIVVGRRLREVVIIGQDANNFKLAGGTRVNKSAKVLAHNPEILEKLKQVDARRAEAEKAYDKVMEETDAENTTIIAEAATFDASQVEVIEDDDDKGSADGAGEQTGDDATTDAATDSTDAGDGSGTEDDSNLDDAAPVSSG